MTLGHVKERPSPLNYRQLHFYFWLGMKYHHSISDPLLLLICEHEIFACQLLLAIVLGDYDSDEEVHQKEVPHDD